MSKQYSVGATAETQTLVPQQAEFYQAQLSAIANLTLRGAGADLHIASDVSQYYLNLGGVPRQSVSSLIWRSPTDPTAFNFAVVPPQDFSRRYFGTATAADTRGDSLWVEGVGLHDTGSRYGRLLLHYSEPTEPSSKVPLAMTALIDSLRFKPVDTEDQETTTLAGVDDATHRRLGNALLTFWDTTDRALDLQSERFSTRAAYDIANLVMRREIESIRKGIPDGRHDSLRPYTDVRGAVAGFVGHDVRKGVTNIMIRDTTTYPNRIDYISIVEANNDIDENVVVSHYAITGLGVATRLCFLPTEEVERMGTSELVDRIQQHRQPLEMLDPQEIETVVRGLYGELGDLLGDSRRPA